MKKFPCYECLLQAICFMDLVCPDYRNYVSNYTTFNISEIIDLREKLPDKDLQEIFINDNIVMEKFFRAEIVDYEFYNKQKKKMSTRLTPILKGRTL